MHVFSTVYMPPCSYLSVHLTGVSWSTYCPMSTCAERRLVRLSLSWWQPSNCMWTSVKWRTTWRTDCEICRPRTLEQRYKHHAPFAVFHWWIFQYIRRVASWRFSVLCKSNLVFKL